MEERTDNRPVLSPRTFGDPDRPRCNEYEKQNTSLKVCTHPNEVSALKWRAWAYGHRRPSSLLVHLIVFEP